MLDVQESVKLTFYLYAQTMGQQRMLKILSTSNQPLLDLIKAKVWKWDGIHKAAQKTIKDSLCKNLTYFSQYAKLTAVVTDASQHGVGAQLVTDGATVAFASRLLSKT